MDESADVAVVIGRFQPFHNGHAGLLKLALETAPRVVFVAVRDYYEDRRWANAVLRAWLLHADFC